MFLDIDGREDMKLIYGTIVAEEKDKVGKEDKVQQYAAIILGLGFQKFEFNACV